MGLKVFVDAGDLIVEEYGQLCAKVMRVGYAGGACCNGGEVFHDGEDFLEAVGADFDEIGERGAFGGSIC